MRKSYWSLLGVVVFSAIVLFSLWLDLHGLFENIAAPRPENEQGTEAAPARTRVPADDLGASHRRKQLEDLDPPALSTWSNVISETTETRNARLAGFVEPPRRINTIRNAIAFGEDIQPVDLPTAPTPHVSNEPERLPEPYRQGDAEEQLDPNETAAIVSEIRQNLGGSLLSRTIFAEGPNGQKSMDFEFVREIRRRERAKELSKTEMERSDPITTPDHSSHVESNASNPTALIPNPIVSQSTARVGALRDAACELDRVADGLERLGLYKRADQLRRTAQQLRLDARRTQHYAK